MYFTKNRFASFLAGIIFAFSPFHYYQSVAVHLGTMHQQWIPFFVYFLFRFFEKFNFKYFIGTAFFAVLIAMTEHQLLAFTILFILVFLAFKFYTQPAILKNKFFWIYIFCSAGLLAILVFGMFRNLLAVATSGNNFLDPGMNSANKYSMGAFDPFVPAPFHWLWPQINSWAGKIPMITIENRGSYFLGYSVIFVIVFFLWNLWKKRANKIDEEMVSNQERKKCLFLDLDNGCILYSLLWTIGWFWKV